MYTFYPCTKTLRLTLTIGASIAIATSLHATSDELPAPIQELKQQGLKIHGEFDAPDGLTGYAGSVRGQTVSVYLTSGGEYAVIGTLINAEGQDVSAERLEQLVNGPRNVELWKKMDSHHWVRDGNINAPRIIYTFSDPNCPYCRHLWENAQPWIESGEVQVRHLMVGILKADSPEKAAAILNADDPSEALAEHYRDGTMPKNQGDEQSELWVRENTQLMRDGQLFATPATFYQDDNGDVHSIMGAPSTEKLRAIMGSDAP